MRIQITKSCNFQPADNAALSPLVTELARITEANSKIAMLNSSFRISDLVAGVAPVGGAPLQPGLRS